MKLTPRELSILMQAETERRYDEYETMASQAMMIRAAYHAKRLKPSDLFKRPRRSSNNNDGRDVKQRMEDRINRLSKYEEFAGMFDDLREEEEIYG